MDFYKALITFKATNKVGYKELGEPLGMGPDAFRMSIKREALTPLQIKELVNVFGIEHSENTEQGENTEQEAIPKGAVPYYDIDFTLSFMEVQNNQQVRPDSYITHPFFKGCDYVVRASGQSMAKVIKHGDAIGLIELKNWAEFLPYGEIYAIVTNDGYRMIKIITKGENENTFTLISKPTDNKKDEFPPQQINKKQILHIFRVQASSHLF